MNLVYIQIQSNNFSGWMRKFKEGRDKSRYKETVNSVRCDDKCFCKEMSTCLWLHIKQVKWHNAYDLVYNKPIKRKRKKLPNVEKVVNDHWIWN